MPALSGLTGRWTLLYIRVFAADCQHIFRIFRVR
ncbi:hypothetical protein TUST1-10_00390 [Vibrio phage ICP1_2004_A]|nr:hypothetical protein TUST1-191_00395 [Vibrio phage ICP1_2006_D]ADX88352.1 hypothetical protein TUST1-182_00395 [Vibrio phage ICP1_2006_C]ADX88579.1 hypothetical protein TUST1-159_00395 [Vibrio phage ICP1_2006_B]ADX88805.1 hypothetical protein TUST1-17_00395 [Vibrio phage ICP1_2006_A]ADX89031.1 hypothetical protein TUST1-15_00395 [Vibrio phage ICP1_2005_A]ADX89263.1 hypothetical protein TUST1-2_00405 [Vibrio phage ICP1_2001_A]ADX89490.1 hypothetical protein TUST1-10_00390 [Vibrio phage ICP1